MPASYPKPTGESVTRHPQQFGWTDLPAVSGIDAPALPPVREWSAETVRWWRELWSKGQASQWDRGGESAVPMAVLYDQLQSEPDRAPTILAELRQHQDRHGLSPKAMLQLRWRFVDDGAAATKAPGRAKRQDRRGRVLQMIPGDASA